MLKPQNFMTFKLDKWLGFYENDADIEVKKTFASFIHELSKMLGTNAFKILGDSLCKLLESPEESILYILYKNLPTVLQVFQSSDNPKLQGYLDNIFATIIDTQKAFEESPNIGWRLHERVLKTFEHFTSFFDGDQVFDTVVQLQKIIVEVFHSITYSRIQRQLKNKPAGSW